jgi:O-acetyl-ADP-ribose deacetylase (regulator of RNase III)
MTVLKTVEGDITTMAVDVIVNAANSELRGGGGVDGAIHRAGGPSIMEECREIIARRGSLPAGQAVLTTAGDLPARWVVHTVGPIWTEAAAEAHDETLASCYRRSLGLAADQEAKSVAFPNISTGVYGFPKERAASIAVDATRRWVDQHPQALAEVVFVCFDDENYRLYQSALSG